MAEQVTATTTAICPACGLAVDLAKPHARLLFRPEIFHNDRCLGYYEGRISVIADWQPISVPPRTSSDASSERLLGVLENGTHVFCYYTPFYLGHERENEKLWTCEGYQHAKPTHWMYLPKRSA